MNTINKYIRIEFFAAILLVACSASQSDTEVRVARALKNMMHKGDVSAKITLDTLSKYEHLYALGALENLKGEALILDSKSWSTSVEGNEMKFHKELNDKAALLVYANVSEWTEVEFSQKEMTKEELEKEIYALAEKNEVDIEKPFPFLIKGMVKSLNWHVINWKDGDMEHSHEKHVNSGLHDEFNDREVEILGFYSQKHQTIFTHHTTFMHLHFKTVDNEIAGHADDVVTGDKMKLYLPKNYK